MKTRTPIRSLLAWAGILAVITACADEAADESGEAVYTIDDGWSGELVVHSAEAVANAPEFAMVEQIRLGTFDGPPETQFFRIADADVSGDELFVLDSGHDEVRVFDIRTGEYLRTIGRRGEGPGELLNPSELNIHGDTIAVAGSQRISFFDLEGTFLTSAPGFIRDEAGMLGRPVQAGGNWYRTKAEARFEPPVTGELFRDTTVLVATDPLTGDTGSEILRYPSGEMYITDGPMGFPVQPYYGPDPVTHGGADGNLYYTPNDEYRIDVIDAATGRQIRRVVSTMRLPPVTDAMVQEAIRADEEMLERNLERGGEPPQGYVESIRKRKDLPIPEVRQLTNGIRTAADGRWAIIRGDLDPNPNALGDPARWDVYDRDGALLGHFVTEPGANIRQFTGDYVIARETDDMDVQYLAVYRLEPVG